MHFASVSGTVTIIPGQVTLIPGPVTLIPGPVTLISFQKALMFIGLFDGYTNSGVPN